MKVFLQEQGYDVWNSVVTGYNATNKPKTATKKELKRNKKITMDFIMEGLPDSVKDKVGNCSSTKEICDKLHNIYSSPITELYIAKEDEKQEVICSSCQIDSEEVEFVVNRSDLFCFTCEKHGNFEIECPYLKIESDETENPNESEIEEEKYLEEELIIALDELTKQRKKIQSLEEKLFKKNSQESFEEAQQVIMKLKSHLEETRKIEENYKIHMDRDGFVRCLENTESMSQRRCIVVYLQLQSVESFGQLVVIDVNPWRVILEIDVNP
jgi:hypothetical protein